jgi:hypothetical protein
VLLPLCVCAIMGSVQLLRGPFSSLANSDPAYPYLFGMLNLLNGRTVAMYEHPGVPVQELGVAILWAAGGFHDAASITRDVLANPEPYLRLVSLGFLAALATSLVVLGWAVLCATGKPWMAALAQCGPLLSVETFLGDTTLVSPEPLLMTASLLFAAASVLIVRQGETPGRIALLAGAAALGITTKFTFGPLFLIPPVLLFRRWRKAALWLGLFIGGVLVLMFPARRRVHVMATWVDNLFWGSGFYGTGAQTIVDPLAYMRGLVDMMANNWPIYLVGLAGAATLGLSFWRDKTNGGSRLTLGLLLVVLLAVSLMAAKLYTARYLNAGVVLSGLLIATTAEFYGRRAALVGIVATVALLLIAGREARARVLRHADENRAAAELTVLLREKLPGCAVAPFYFSGDPVYALRFGLDYARVGKIPYSEILMARYGDRLFFNIGSRTFNDWRNRSIPFGEALAMHGCLILRGVARDSVMADPEVSPYILDRCSWGVEAIYVAGGQCRTAFEGQRAPR